MSDTHNHNHEDCIGCGCYNPAFDLLLNTTNSNETKDARAESVQENEVPKSMIFYNGIIYPVQRKDENEKIVDVTDPDFYYEAMEIKNGEIEWLGTNEEAMKNPLFKDKSYIQDLEGKTILPGLIEPHCHIVPSAAGDFGKYPVPLSKEWGDKIWKNYSPFDNQSDPLDPDPHYPQCLKPDYTRENLLKDVIGDAKKIAEKNNKLSYLEKKNGPYWLLGLGVDPSLMYEVYPEKHWTIDNCVDSSFFREVDLDFERSTPSLAVPPILLMSASGHTAYVNKIALSLAYSLEKEKPTPGFLEKYPTEEKYVINENCVLQEMAQMTPVMRAICKTQLKDLKDGIEGSINDYIKSARKLGVTMVYDAGMQQDWANAYFFKDGTPINHGIRIGMSLPYGIENKFEKANEDLKKQFEDFDSFQPPTEKTINGYWGSIKITSDGSNQGLTGYQSLNYVCPSLPDPNEKGIYNFQTQAKLDPLSVDTLNDGINHNNSLVKAIVKEGWPILIHANGNQAIDYTINAYKESLGTPPTKEEMEEFQNKRNRIEHCSLLNEQNLKDMKEYGIQPSFLIGHVGYWGYVFDKYIFPKSQTVNSAAEHLDLCKSALDHSLRITLHSDNAVTPLGPLRYMEQAITRIMEGSEQAKDYYTNLKKKSGDKPTNTVFKDLPVLNESERITVMQALKAVTLDAAWQCQADHLVGSLLPGKLADFIILEKNPMLMDTPEKAYLNMRNIKVLETWVGGVQYKNG